MGYVTKSKNSARARSIAFLKSPTVSCKISCELVRNQLLQTTIFDFVLISIHHACNNIIIRLIFHRWRIDAVRKLATRVAIAKWHYTKILELIKWKLIITQNTHFLINFAHFISFQTRSCHLSARDPARQIRCQILRKLQYISTLIHQLRSLRKSTWKRMQNLY